MFKLENPWYILISLHFIFSEHYFNPVHILINCLIFTLTQENPSPPPYTPVTPHIQSTTTITHMSISPPIKFPLVPFQVRTGFVIIILELNDTPPVRTLVIMKITQKALPQVEVVNPH